MHASKFDLWMSRLTWPKIFVMYLALHLFLSFALYLAEGGRNQRCDTLPEAFWANTVFLLSGFEDFGPQTAAGRFVSFLTFAAGLIAVAVVTGKITSVFVVRAQGRRDMPRDLADHIAICNWHEGGERIIRDIHAADAQPSVEIVVVTTADVPEEQLRLLPEFERVFFMRSDPTLHSGLKACRVHTAKSVIILSDRRAPDPDATTALIALAITKLCADGRRPHIVAEAQNHRKTEHLLDAGVDEIVCPSEYELGILAQCGMLGKFGKLSKVYEHLLACTESTSEFYILPPDEMPGDLVGQSFQAACRIVQERTCATENPVIVLGLVRNDALILNPRSDTGHAGPGTVGAIEATDGLVLIAHHRPDLRAVWGS